MTGSGGYMSSQGQMVSQEGSFMNLQNGDSYNMASQVGANVQSQVHY